MKKYLKFSALMLGLFGFFCSSQAFAYSSADYYKAGLKLYSVKNYDQAVRYFGAAIQLDPNNTAALQARGNCHYALGDYPGALADYQKVQALSPSDALAQFISKIQDKINSTSSAAPAFSAAPNPNFTQGVSYFQQKLYAQAAACFQQAAQQDPNNYKPYYYLFYSQMMLGDTKDAAVALGICNLKRPNASTEAYYNKLQARLSPDDAQWVSNQVAEAQNGKAYQSAPQYADAGTIGIRLEPTLQTFNITALNTLETADQSTVTAFDDPDLGFNASVPTGGFEITIEPTYRIASNIEIGLPISYDSIGTYTDSVTAVGTSASEGTTFSFTDISIGLDARYFIMTGEIQPWVGAGVAFHMVSLSSPSSAGSTVTGSNSASISGIGEQVQLGIDWHLDKMFALSLYGGYQLANMGSTWSSNGQTGNLFGDLTGDTSSSDDAFDLSGPFAGLQISAFFH
jgi:tetratricopeptide (TPR) repeat protein